MEASQTHKFSILPLYKKCKLCKKLLLQSHKVQGCVMYLCNACQVLTNWSHETILQKSLLSHVQIEHLLTIFLDKKTPKEAENILEYYFVNEKVSLNSIQKYFTLFCQITLKYYEERMNFTLLEKEVEIDESHLFREKKSFAPHRNYKQSSIWIFGMGGTTLTGIFVQKLTSRTLTGIFTVKRDKSFEF